MTETKTRPDDMVSTCLAACHDSTKPEKVEVEGVVAPGAVFGPDKRIWVGAMLRVLGACLGWSFHWKERWSDKRSAA